MSKHDQIFSCANFFNNAWNRCKQHFMFLFFFSSFSSNAAPSVDCISQTFYTYKILVDPFITISSSLKCLMNYILAFFEANLMGSQKGSEITVFVWESNSKWLLPKLNFTQFLNRNVSILSRRLYSPSLKNEAWLEDAQSIFPNFPYICL